eukprot:scaffold123941_cov63-Phaeocystis_antarctica.AAC.2
MRRRAVRGGAAWPAARCAVRGARSGRAPPRAASRRGCVAAPACRAVRRPWPRRDPAPSRRLAGAAARGHSARRARAAHAAAGRSPAGRRARAVRVQVRVQGGRARCARGRRLTSSCSSGSAAPRSRSTCSRCSSPALHASSAAARHATPPPPPSGS